MVIDTNARLETPEDKKRWLVEMRLKFCRTDHIGNAEPGMPAVVNEDGSINQEYFRSARPVVEDSRKWTDDERTLLIAGIAKHGIGHFREISEEFLPAWTGNDLRIKAMRLMGRQNLSGYKDWKGSEEDIAKEFARNRLIGTSLGAWKNSTLVADEAGLVEQTIARTNAGEDIESVIADLKSKMINA